MKSNHLHSTSPYVEAITEALRIPNNLKKDGRLDSLALPAHEHIYRGALCAVAKVQALAMDRENALDTLDKARRVAHIYAKIPSIGGVRSLCGIAVTAQNLGCAPEADFEAARQKANQLRLPNQAVIDTDATQAIAEVFAYQGKVDNARKEAEKIWHSGGDHEMLSRKDLAIAFAESGHFPAALEEAKEVGDVRHRCGVWDIIASRQAETGEIAEAEKTVTKISDDWISKLEHRFVRELYNDQCNDVVGAWSNCLESALRTAWILNKASGDLDTFRELINRVNRILSPLCRAKAWAAFARYLVQN